MQGFKYIVIVIMLAVNHYSHAYDVSVKNPVVLDGDTIDTGIVVGRSLSSLKLRIAGIDAPEMKGKCEKERMLAREAKDFLAFTLKDQVVDINYHEWDKYGGRVVGVPYLHDVPLNEEMLRRGYAVPYSGGKKMKDWCK
jgi:endonuclease YncB( thermonuclease family)